MIGEAAEEFQKQLEGDVHCVQCGALEKAVAAAYSDAAASNAASPAVILSPACASYDQFANFISRGDAFREYVHALSAENGEAA